MNDPLKRSHEPIFWLLFGAGGMLAAMLGAMLVFLLAFGVPSGLLPAEALSYTTMRDFAGNVFGKGFLFAVVALFFWHAVHRIFHSLHDIGIHAGLPARVLVYGTAAIGTLIAAAALLAIGF
ncbi:MAG: fumarate reductase subunit D [Candidatus Dactylopiibacterium carminicum]|uniref:Fumarate reductase subunit D n=1 Tax=Candidatus Dactylopiibacterium carminicum TaxID=857335 RepID=A0A272EX13_9RHOO|nr:fumarate reductase subunit FrdD [Candidatus Dactylopiibacterium carminicum]KAF7600288.1 fumarate reductase subunit FrdD [Candidatus Dactylopiibacterium carminicum]PAS94658.1 MAG: fumarate reductase subunit D [Candidatus Dactylopiibacterium carminicum]PAS96945.1 MAG: fumarate reductase subunit D [Candidatus Dactylopiibacterium carminicum]PAT00289.1 MAG: fumarate reductase subunit D [Candidatus Dactylopiibacterium carminicum]